MQGAKEEPGKECNIENCGAQLPGDTEDTSYTGSFMQSEMFV